MRHLILLSLFPLMACSINNTTADSGEDGFFEGPSEPLHYTRDIALPSDTFVGNVTENNVQGFCDGYTKRTVQGDVRIRASHLERLNDLRCVERIHGKLTIQSNAALTSLAGLEQLLRVDGDIYIAYNTHLPSLIGLDSLRTVGGDVIIYDNRITALSGLENLTHIGGDLNIGRNSDLRNTHGLIDLYSVGGDVDIWNNAQLSDISALSLESAQSLRITHNAALSMAQAQGATTPLEGVATLEIVVGR